MAAVDPISFRHVAIVADLRLTRRALPRCHRRTPKPGIAATRPLIHECGWSNAAAGARRRNHEYFAAAVSFSLPSSCPTSSPSHQAAFRAIRYDSTITGAAASLGARAFAGRRLDEASKNRASADEAV